jgi:hypothetical protein
MTSAIETIARKTTNRHKVTTFLKGSSQGHGMAHGPFKSFIMLYNQGSMDQEQCSSSVECD